MTAVNGVRIFHESLSSLSDEKYFSTIFKDTLKICAENKVEIPTVKKRKTLSLIDDCAKTQYHFQSKEDYEMVFTYYPFLNSLVSGIDERFDQGTCQLVSTMGKLINLQVDESNLKILSKKLCVNADDFQAQVKLLKNCKSDIGSTVPKGL